MGSLNMCNKLLAITFIAAHAVITPTYRPASRNEERVVNKFIECFYSDLFYNANHLFVNIYAFIQFNLVLAVCVWFRSCAGA